MNKKGNVGLVFSTIAIIVITGFFLSVFAPTIDEFRVDLINSFAEHPESTNILLELIVYGIIPYMWLIYILLSVFFIIFVVNFVAQNPFG